jgi:8-oxo-dGTP pyrophosphatase MutT (NUDIX family)
MAEDWPKIVSRRTIPVSPWMRLMERAVEFTAGAEPEIYHAVDQADYIAIVARTADGLFPIVRQYRPALERRTWELPAGMVDKGEDTAECCRRELLEETGLKARKVHDLGTYAPCSARLSNLIHSFFVECESFDPAAKTEHGIEVKLVSAAEFAALIRSGEFVLQIHIGALMLAAMRGHIDPAPFFGK